MIVGEAARGEQDVAGLQADESVPDIGRAVVGRHADDARIEPGAPAHLLDERHAGVTGNDDIAAGLLPLPRDDLALGGEDEAVDQVDAAMDHAQPPAADAYSQRFRQVRHPGAACGRNASIGEGVPALGEALAFAARLEAARAVGGACGQLLLAVAGDDVAPPRAYGCRRFFRLGAIGHHVARANAVGCGNAELLGAGS